jgi:DNA-binding NarL/FixJ family response regulator
MTSGEASGLRLFLAEDHLVVREGLRALLQQEGFTIVGEASDGRTAVEACHALQPDIAILDLAMPQLNGIDAARAIRQLSPDTQIILLTMYTEESCVRESLRVGIRGYVLKSSAAFNLVDAIHAVAKDEMYLAPGISRALVEGYLSNVSTPLDPLSAREREVLQLLAEGKNVKEIGALLGISARTAETHRTRIMTKLDIHEIAGLVRYAIERGLISVASPMRYDWTSEPAPTARADSEPGDPA